MLFAIYKLVYIRCTDLFYIGYAHVGKSLVEILEDHRSSGDITLRVDNVVQALGPKNFGLEVIMDYIPEENIQEIYKKKICELKPSLNKPIWFEELDNQSKRITELEGINEHLGSTIKMLTNNDQKFASVAEKHEEWMTRHGKWIDNQILNIESVVEELKNLKAIM